MIKENDKRIKQIAQSFFEIAKAEKNIQKLEREIEELKELLDNNKLKEFLSDKSIPKGDRINRLFDAMGEGASPLIQSICSTIISLDLLERIEEILCQYKGLVDSYKKRVDVEVISAVELDGKTLEKIKGKIDKKTDFDTRIKNTVDRSILGGLVIKFKDQIIDLSIKGKMNRLKDNLKSIDMRGEKFGA